MDFAFVIRFQAPLCSGTYDEGDNKNSVSSQSSGDKFLSNVPRPSLFRRLDIVWKVYWKISELSRQTGKIYYISCDSNSFR